jgi:hypothetical protein
MDDHLLPDWLTPTWLGTTLGREVTAFTTKRIGDGLVGMNLRLAVASSDPEVPRSLVVKLPSPDPLSRASGVSLRNYEREVCFYRDLASTVDMRVAACHHAAWHPESGDFVLVLEDLAPGAQGNQLTGCSVDQARTAVVELASLHGPRWNDASLWDIEWLGRRTSADDTARMVEYWGLFMPGFLATYARHLSTEALDLLTVFGHRIADWIDGREEPFTVTHGDYRLDNLMFATAEGGYPVAAVDWQTPGHGPALADVSYFMGAGLLPAASVTVPLSDVMRLIAAGATPPSSPFPPPRATPRSPIRSTSPVTATSSASPHLRLPTASRAASSSSLSRPPAAPSPHPSPS